MKTRMVLSIALVALATVPAFGGVLHTAAGLSVTDVVAEKLGELKTSTVTTALPNPSATTVTAPPEAKALFSVPAVDVVIKKEPVVTVADAPCKQVCADKCKLELHKSCKDVSVVTKECNPTKKAMTKKMCSKKCVLTFETPKVFKSLSEVKQPNPSAPPTVAETQLPSLDVSRDLHIDLAAGKGDSKLSTILTAGLAVSKDDASLSVNADADAKVVASVDDLSVTSKVTMDADKVTALIGPATSGRRLQGLAHKAAEVAVLSKVSKSLPVPSCEEVCQDVHFEVPDLECHEVTHTIKTCDMVPEKTCDKECVCIPQKTIAVNLPKKPTLSFTTNN